MKYALDLCCGKGGATQAFRGKSDWIVVGVDVDKRFYQYWQGKNVSFVLADVTAVDWQSFLEDVGIPRVDFLWASPPCERFSIANRMFPKPGIREALNIVGSCLEAIAAMRPYWVLENPKGRLRWFLGKPSMSIHLSDYGSRWMKATDLWSNLQLPLLDCIKPYEPSYTSTQNKGQGSTGLLRERKPENRALMPYGLSEAVYTSVQQRLEAQP